MATPYSEVYNQFLMSVQDYDILDEGTNLAERELFRVMKRAISDSYKMIKRVDEIDLTLRDDDREEFEEDLTDDIIELLVTGMQYYWLDRQLLNTDNMHNVLNTRDFSQYAPQNLIFRLREIHNDAEDRWYRVKRHHAHETMDIATLGGLING